MTLAGVLITAGAAKLLDPNTVPTGLAVLVPRPEAARAATVVLSLTEVAAGAALIPAATAPVAAHGALALLGPFTAESARAAVTRDEPCACLGRWSPPTGRWSVVLRNA